MWSGEGGSEQFAQGGQQWFNPMMYQNVNHENVDWASLAQQWIQMKETFPTVDQMNVLAPPPPPPLEKKTEEKKEEDEGEKGEAPMDMELDSKEEDGKTDPVAVMNGWGAGGMGGAQWTNWQQWGWGWNGAAMGYVGAEGGEAPVAYPTLDQTSGVDKHGNSRHAGFASSNQNSQFIRHPNRVWRKGDKTLRGSGNYNRNERDERSESPENPVLDAAKRKTLPAWIREGLEKMEREKQKKLLAEKEKKEREARALQEPVFDPLNPTKSKFDSESELSEAEEPPERERRVSPLHSPEEAFHREPEPEPVQRKLTKPEILEQVMMVVRKQLTQLLMRVTGEEIEKCVRDVMSGYPGLKGIILSMSRSRYIILTSNWWT
uniref:Arginine/serine-rich protein PNISR n=1 Tax=Cacopsylla melanoneura TaxID=428564 RepID=A0A8D8LLP8_9HEMI